ncbi:uncharacterized protein C8Q71DRAFT_753402 [Rhodofomes roseus]|uniref:Uncharacterized protein n=1 Tax=Rhodofomes roseus TaxID=34475 RepID=A0ABQ8KJ00_9APHY|nr:uncharacterized protein C8Q71DRAFT_753402 [Rhodofomes roseus]KAH9837592.1 hypothetical protein C8Q71DRAFT_753402 [Rhodofomes roseus]
MGDGRASERIHSASCMARKRVSNVSCAVVSRCWGISAVFCSVLRCAAPDVEPLHLSAIAVRLSGATPEFLPSRLLAGRGRSDACMLNEGSVLYYYPMKGNCSSITSVLTRAATTREQQLPPLKKYDMQRRGGLSLELAGVGIATYLVALFWRFLGLSSSVQREERYMPRDLPGCGLG